MKSSVQISRGIESLFGTRDENIRLIENGLNVRTRLLNDCLEIEGEDSGVARAAGILNDYAALIREGHVFNNGDLNSFLRVVTADAETTLRGLVESGKQRSFGKKTVAPKDHDAAPLRGRDRALTIWSSASVPPAPAKPIWPWPWRFPRCWRSASAASF